MINNGTVCGFFFFACFSFGLNSKLSKVVPFVIKMLVDVGMERKKKKKKCT